MYGHCHLYKPLWSVKTGIHLSQNRLSEVPQEEGYVYRRPKKDLSHKQDADLREQVKKALEEVKKNARNKRVRLLFMDESGFSLNYPLSKCWMKSH